MRGSLNSRNASLTQAKFERIKQNLADINYSDCQRMYISGFVVKVLGCEPINMYDILQYGLQRTVLREPWRWGE